MPSSVAANAELMAEPFQHEARFAMKTNGQLRMPAKFASRTKDLSQ
jgi:hypothetical protein